MNMRAVHPVTDQLEPEELDPAQIISGNPETSVLVLAESEDGSQAGLWRCTTGVVTDTEVEETFMVITGRARIEFENGSTVEVGPGDTRHFEGGEKTTWYVEETLLKSYWIKG